MRKDYQNDQLCISKARFVSENSSSVRVVLETSSLWDDTHCGNTTGADCCTGHAIDDPTSAHYSG